MPFFVITYEEPHYYYRVVEADSLKDARNKSEISGEIVFENDEKGQLEATPQDDSGPWSTQEAAENSIDDNEPAGSDMGTIICSTCHRPTAANAAHLHQGEWIGDNCCWDDRLKSSE